MNGDQEQSSNPIPRPTVLASTDEQWLSTNRSAWNSMVQEGHRLAKPAQEELFKQPLKAVDGIGWLGPSIKGKSVLCLAGGGGRQGSLYALREPT